MLIWQFLKHENRPVKNFSAMILETKIWLRHIARHHFILKPLCGALNQADIVAGPLELLPKGSTKFVVPQYDELQKKF